MPALGWQTRKEPGVEDRCFQDEVVEFLSDPATFALSEPVVRIDTHAAIVFLAGERAYKLKRAVRYPYLDFSTAAKRKAVCEAELALNRRTAPDLYLGVEGVGRLADGTLALGRGEPVDWLVVMNRFSPDALFDTMARRGVLTASLVRDLADGIAAFHDRAEIVPGPGAVRVRAVIEGNHASMKALAPGLFAPEECRLIHLRSLAALERLSGLLDHRARTGHVRHCHGDLHLANICLWQGQATLFDCLEFDFDLATIDVLYDLAFPLMDLWLRDLRAEASLLFNRYCDLRDENDGLGAMGLFLSMRAAVRAHVRALAVERQPLEERGSEVLDDARAYLAAAVTFLDQRPARMIAIGGLSGTGKSTLAGALAPKLGTAPGARWLRTDVLRKRLAGVQPEAPLPQSAYTVDRNREIYSKLKDDARAVLTSGTCVIVDGVFADVSERRAMQQIACAADIPFCGLWLEAPREVMHARVGARAGDASDADAAVVDRQLGYELGDLAGWNRIPAEGPSDMVLGRVMRLIEHRDL